MLETDREGRIFPYSYITKQVLDMSSFCQMLGRNILLVSHCCLFVGLSVLSLVRGNQKKLPSKMTGWLKNTPFLFLQQIFDCFQILSLGTLTLYNVKHYSIISIAFCCMAAKNVAPDGFRVLSAVTGSLKKSMSNTFFLQSFKQKKRFSFKKTKGQHELYTL